MKIIILIIYLFLINALNAQPYKLRLDSLKIDEKIYLDGVDRMPFFVGLDDSNRVGWNQLTPTVKQQVGAAVIENAPDDVTLELKISGSDTTIGIKVEGVISTALAPSTIILIGDIISDSIVVAAANLRSDISDSLTFRYTNLAKTPYNLNPDNNASTNADIFQSAMDNASDGDMFYLPGGTYKIDTTILIDKSITLMGDGPEITIIDADSINGPTYCNSIFIYGSRGDTTRLKQSTTVGMRYFIVNDASFLEEDDMFFINDTSKSNPGQEGDTTSWYFKGAQREDKGEQHIVDKVNGDTVFVVGKVWDTYNITRGRIRLEEINAVTFTLKDFALTLGVDDTSQRCITASYHKNSSIENVHVAYGGYYGFYITYGLNFSFDKCQTKNTNAYGGGYGLNLASVSNVSVSNSRFINYRSAIDINATTSWGASRNINIHDNLFMTGGHARSSPSGDYADSGTDMMRGSALASHWGAEMVFFHGNTIIGGAQVAKVRGSNFTITNNYATGRMRYFARMIGSGGNLRINNNQYDGVTLGREHIVVPTDPYWDFLAGDSTMRNSNLNAFLMINEGAYYQGSQDTSLFLEVKGNRVNGVQNSFMYLYADVKNVDISYNDISFINSASSYHSFIAASPGTDTVVAQQIINTNHPEHFLRVESELGMATRFTADFGDSLYKIDVLLRGRGTPPDSFTIGIWSDSSEAKPDTLMWESDSMATADIDTSTHEWISATLSSPVYVSLDSIYWVVLSGAAYGAPFTAEIHWRANSNVSGRTVRSGDAFATYTLRENFSCCFKLHTIGRSLANSTMIWNTFYNETGGSMVIVPKNITLTGAAFSYIDRSDGSCRWLGGSMSFDNDITFNEKVDMDGGLELGGTIQIGENGSHLWEISEPAGLDSLDIITGTDTLRVGFRKITK